MTEEERKLYDVIADWWDEVFVRPQNPKTIRNDAIIDLVKSISEIDDGDNDWDNDWDIPEGVDPYNLTGRDPTQSVWKNGKRPSPDYYETFN